MHKAAAGTAPESGKQQIDAIRLNQCSYNKIFIMPTYQQQ
jgi:hypothetical protein